MEAIWRMVTAVWRAGEEIKALEPMEGEGIWEGRREGHP